MRGGVKQRLIEEIAAIGGRVLEIHEDASGVAKPYVVVARGADATAGSGWAGFRTVFEIWPYGEQTGFAAIDALSRQIVAALDGQRISDAGSGETFTCRYEGNVGADTVETAGDVLTRGLRFTVAGLPRAAQAGPSADDDWLAALADWTASLLASPWTVYRGQWPLVYERPSVLWRLAGMESVRVGASAELRKRFVGHVAGRSEGEQLAGAVRIIEGLGGNYKLPLQAAESKFLKVSEPVADVLKDELAEGQISVALSRPIVRPAEEAPLMQRVSYDQIINY